MSQGTYVNMGPDWGEDFPKTPEEEQAVDNFIYCSTRLALGTIVDETVIEERAIEIICD